MPNSEMSNYKPAGLAVCQYRSSRRFNSKSIFQDICNPYFCIHHLLPQPRDNSVLSPLRTVTPLPRL